MSESQSNAPQEQEVNTPTQQRVEEDSNFNTPRNPVLSPATVASSLVTPRSISSPRTPLSRRSQRSLTNTPRKSLTSTPRRRQINTNPENLAEDPETDILKEYYEG